MPSLNLEGHEAASSVLWMTYISLLLMTLLVTRIEQRGFFKIMNVSFYLFFFSRCNGRGTELRNLSLW